jgi:hypothetical protein
MRPKFLIPFPDSIFWFPSQECDREIRGSTYYYANEFLSFYLLKNNDELSKKNTHKHDDALSFKMTITIQQA